MTTPAVPFDSYGQPVLDGIAAVLVAVFPYAAAITAFAIGVGMVKRWLGHRSATSLGGGGWVEHDDGYTTYRTKGRKSQRYDEEYGWIDARDPR